LRLLASCSYITQATIESLEKATDGNPRHPMRLAFGDNYQPVRFNELPSHTAPTYTPPLSLFALTQISKAKEAMSHSNCTLAPKPPMHTTVHSG